MIEITRRRFLTVAGGLVLSGCSNGRGVLVAPSTTTATTAPSGPVATPPAVSGSAPTTSLPVEVTTTTMPRELVPDGRVLVMVELAGGNDAINTLVPLTGAYHDLRPTIALADDELLAHTALPGHGIHPSLEPLLPLFDAGRVTTLAAIGFPEPDRSHFVSTDRWMRADRMDETTGWLGRWLDTLADDVGALGVTALGGDGAMLRGETASGTVIDEANAFAFPAELSNASVRGLADPLSADPLIAAAQQAFLTSVGAVAEFDAIADAVRASAPATDPYAGSRSFTTGLAVAAQLVVGDVDARVVTVTVGGFDTHGQQLELQSDLLADLANGLAGFWRTVDDAGMGDRVLLTTHSEFGRRVRENGSAGTDHGAAGLSFVMGDAVDGALHGSIDTGDVLDGDLRPQIDPRTMFTACLDWLGADVEAVLGRRYDETRILV